MEHKKGKFWRKKCIKYFFQTEFLPTNFFNVDPKLNTRFFAEAIYDVFWFVLTTVVSYRQKL